MRANKLICLVSGVMLVAPAWAGETTIVNNVLGPEGPLYIDGNLYYVGWVSNTLSKWDGETTTVLNHTEGLRPQRPRPDEGEDVPPRLH